MRTFVLIACCKTKLEHPAPARELYRGALFRKALAYSRQLNPDAVFVLSAKYGLIGLDDEIAPYEKTLNSMPIHERRVWYNRVIQQLNERTDPAKDRFVILASMRYREGLVDQMSHVHVPLAGLGIGRQLQWLDRRLRNES
ncbi:MAG: hypothetical protein GC164_14240 [Phycisphaera sp.]|nr:hypothetical protein [Phycisphaera sp.]